MKLLHYTSYRYFLFTALLTLISIPIFYVSLSKVFVGSIDKDLRQQAREIPTYMGAIKSEQDLALWKALDNDLNIVPADSSDFSPKPFTIKKKLPFKDESEDFRVLQKQVDILGKKYIVDIESSLIEKEDLIRTILSIQLGILFLLLSGAVLINYFINRKIWKPFYDCLYSLKQFNIEHALTDEPKELRIQEFEQLNQSIHVLSVRVHQAYFSQKEFIENASHELQTPLTVLKFKLELLLQDRQLTREQGELIADMYREIEQMQELNNNLLLLSKIENGQFVNSETINLVDIIEDVKDELSLLAESKLQHVKVRYKLKDIILPSSNKILLKVLIKNLLLNAIQYSAVEADIWMYAASGYLKVSNPGRPLEIPEEEMFKRFGRNSCSQKGNGLGLSIVKAIAQYNSYNISYEYISGLHNFKLQWN